MKHYSIPHQNTRTLSQAAFKALEDYKRELDKEAENTRLDYERQLHEKAEDDWLRNLAVGCMTFYELTGDRKKTGRFAERLSEKLAKSKADGITTEELCGELARATDIELEIKRS